MPLSWQAYSSTTREVLHFADSRKLRYEITALGPKRFHTAIFVRLRNGTMPPVRWPVELASLTEAKQWCQRYDVRHGAYANRTKSQSSNVTGAP